MVNLYNRAIRCIGRWVPLVGSRNGETSVPDEILAEARKFAAEDNLRTTPPEDERITLRLPVGGRVLLTIPH